MSSPSPSGVQRVVLLVRGFCWLCGLPAVCGERLPGRRHRTRLLCRLHAECVFGPEQRAAHRGRPPAR